MVLAYEAYVIHYASFSQCNLALLSRWDCSSCSSSRKQDPEKEHETEFLRKQYLHDGFLLSDSSRSPCWVDFNHPALSIMIKSVWI